MEMLLKLQFCALEIHMQTKSHCRSDGRKVPYGVKVLVAEGLHPFHDERVRDLMDVKIYLDISDEVKFAWKIQRDMKERGHSLESIKASIAARKHDFDAYIDPQKKHADIIIQVSNQLRMHPSCPALPAAAAAPPSAASFKSYVCAALDRSTTLLKAACLLRRLKTL